MLCIADSSWSPSNGSHYKNHSWDLWRVEWVSSDRRQDLIGATWAFLEVLRVMFTEKASISVGKKSLSSNLGNWLPAWRCFLSQHFFLDIPLEDLNLQLIHIHWIALPSNRDFNNRALFHVCFLSFLFCFHFPECARWCELSFDLHLCTCNLQKRKKPAKSNFVS